MKIDEKKKIIDILKKILDVDDKEIKDCAIESLIEMIENMEIHEEETYR